MLDKTNHLPFIYQVEQIICYWIIIGKYQLDEFLPSQAKLSEYFEVSRITIRGAISNLVNQGILESFQGKGTRVKKIPLSTIYNTVPTEYQTKNTSTIQNMECKIVSAQYNIKNPSEIFCPISTWNTFHLVQGIRMLDNKPVVWEDTFADASIFSQSDDIITIKHTNPYEINVYVQISHYIESFFYQECTEFLSEKLKTPVNTPILGIKRITYCKDIVEPIECRLSYQKHESYQIEILYQ